MLTSIVADKKFGSNDKNLIFKLIKLLQVEKFLSPIKKRLLF